MRGHSRCAGAREGDVLGDRAVEEEVVLQHDADLSRVRTGSGPRVMASLRNIAIGIHRLNGETNMRHAARHCSQNSRRGFALLCGSKPRERQTACALMA